MIQSQAALRNENDKTNKWFAISGDNMMKMRKTSYFPITIFPEKLKR